MRWERQFFSLFLSCSYLYMNVYTVYLHYFAAHLVGGLGYSVALLKHALVAGYKNDSLLGCHPQGEVWMVN